LDDLSGLASKKSTKPADEQLRKVHLGSDKVKEFRDEQVYCWNQLIGRERMRTGCRKSKAKTTIGMFCSAAIPEGLLF
jgi:hypothetical protein